MFPQVSPQKQVPPAPHKAFPAVTPDLRPVLGSFPTTGERPGGWSSKVTEFLGNTEVKTHKDGHHMVKSAVSGDLSGPGI